MIPKSQIDQTVERFQIRTPERQESEAKLTTGSPLTANDPARVEQRLARIMAVEGRELRLCTSTRLSTCIPIASLAASTRRRTSSRRKN